MELTFKVNQNNLMKAKLLFAAMAIALAACVTVKPEPSAEETEEKVLAHQMSIIINHLNIGKPDKAHFELRPLLQKHPERAELHNLMGLAYLGLGRAKLSEKYFRRAFDLKPDPAFGLNITSAQIQQKRFDDAIKLAKEFIKEGLGDYKYPERFDHNLGLAYERLKQDRTAIKHYRQALALNPSNYQTLMQLGRLYERIQQIKRAEPIFKRATDVCVQCYEPVKRRSDMLIKLNRKPEALRILMDYVEVQDLRPQDRANARKYVSKLDPSFLQPIRKK